MPVSLKTRRTQITPRLDGIKDPAVAQALNDLARVVSEGFNNVYDDLNRVGLMKALSFTRDLSLASSDQTLTGFGFTPRNIIVLAGVNGAVECSWGFSDGGVNANLMSQGDIAADQMGIEATACIHILQTALDFQTAVVKSFNNDGLVLTWTKTGTPAGTATLIVLAQA